MEKKGGVISLEHADVIIGSTKSAEAKAVSVATYMDRFILYHEVSHHILGHTDQGLNPFSFIEELPDICKGWMTTAIKSHRQEYQADAGAIMLTLQRRSSDHAVEQQKEFEITLGCLLCMTVIGQLVQDVNKSSPTHPAVSMRFDRCVSVINECCRYEEPGILRKVIEDIKRFQFLLAKTQGYGIGTRWAEDDFE
jgi:hypothetical protein